jgi:hypothetical protein
MHVISRLAIPIGSSARLGGAAIKPITRANCRETVSPPDALSANPIVGQSMRRW